MAMNKIDAVRFGIAGGLVAACACFVLTLLSLISGHGIEALNVLRSLFWGYDISVSGSLVGSVYGFVLGFIKLFMLALIYNVLIPD
jgi:hypothetical protein